MDYRAALLVDKRTYFQYYIALIRKKQIIIFTFFPIDDYNLITLKIALFLLSFSLYICINAFFYTDDTMHKIKESHGNMILSIHIIYSSPLLSNLFHEIISF